MMSITVSVPAVPSTDTDADDSNDSSHVIVTSEASAATNANLVIRSPRLAASACKEKIYATQDRVESIELTRSDNFLLGVPFVSCTSCLAPLLFSWYRVFRVYCRSVLLCVSSCAVRRAPVVVTHSDRSLSAPVQLFVPRSPVCPVCYRLRPAVQSCRVYSGVVELVV